MPQLSPYSARRQLEAVTLGAREIREALTAELAAVAKSSAWSESYKAERSKNLRATAADALAGLQRRADSAAADLAAYRPTVAADPAAVSRAATRVTQLLDSGQSLAEILNLAATSRDGAMIEAVRESAPTLVAIEARRNGTKGSAAERLVELGAAADRAATRVLAGTPAGKDATDALLGRAHVGITDHALTAAQATAEGRHLDQLGHAISGKYAQQEYDALAAELAAPTA